MGTCTKVYPDTDKKLAAVLKVEVRSARSNPENIPKFFSVKNRESSL